MSDTFFIPDSTSLFDSVHGEGVITLTDYFWTIPALPNAECSGL